MKDMMGEKGKKHEVMESKEHEQMKGMPTGAHMEEFMRKAHGSNDDSVMMAHQGASMFMGGKSSFPAQNPLTATGGKVMQNMMKEYGEKQGEKIFYATMNKKGMGKKWHK